MKYAVIAARYIFGVWFIMSGLRGISPEMPMGRNPIPRELLSALVSSDIIWAVKGVDFLVGGAASLVNLYVPLALDLGFPVTLMVAYVCLYLEFPIMRPLIGGLTLAFHVCLLFAYFDYYKSFLTMRSRPAGPMYR